MFANIVQNFYIYTYGIWMYTQVLSLNLHFTNQNELMPGENIEFYNIEFYNTQIMQYCFISMFIWF